ncbi:chemotaxis protein CheR [Aquibium carbonis]|uniref:Chemotaxis protein methyltransferase n=1 Tax=Aquibium carbonis TaxID=2495581 RepID=A0A3R9Y8A0_9HYPH|nr:CheR family methyltransferase [Aquibium carbonis]RST85398.1 chemotaxis protein CheR [Aquibium carbonis]
MPEIETGTAQSLSDKEFERLATFIGDKVGIRLPPTKRLMVEGRLRKRLRALNIPDMQTYCRLVIETHTLDAEVTHLIDVITTNKTDFFREVEHFDLMRSRLVPALLAERAKERMPLLKIWSAAASTGAEAYTAAMVLHDMTTKRNTFRFAILGTDISTAVLEQARSGIYPADMMAPVPKDLRARYVMEPVRKTLRPDVRIVPELRRLASFERLNLMDETYPFDRDVDIILVRNVLIYFEKEDQSAVVKRLVGHLRPRGYILLGHSESMVGNMPGLAQVAPAVFQKI